MIFSDYVKSIRQKSILSQEEFAKELGVSYTTVNRWENGKTLPSYKTMKILESYCLKHGIGFIDPEQVWSEKNNIAKGGN